MSPLKGLEGGFWVVVWGRMATSVVSRAPWLARGLEQDAELIGETVEFSSRGPARPAGHVRRQDARDETEIGEQGQ